MTTAAAAPGQLIGDRYRIERRLGEGGDGLQGELWLGCDQMASEAPVVLRRLGPEADQERARRLWGRLQGVLHPQVPRFGAAIGAGDQLWLVREWQAGRTFAALLQARRERQLVFGAGEVLLLLRQLLPVLAVLHGNELMHGDVTPANLLRRDSDGLPVLLDFGLVRQVGEAAAALPLAATPGYAPAALGRGEAPAPWMDLHGLGVTALVLLSGEEPARLLDPASLAWRWPAALEAEPELRGPLQRLLASDPAQRFASAGAALAAFQDVPMPDSTGPVPRADRTVALVPPPAALPAFPEPSAAPDAQAQVDGEAGPPPSPPRLRRRSGQRREDISEGGLWPVLIALVLSAVVGTALGWWWLGRGRAPLNGPEAALEQPSSLPPAEVDQRQQLLSRLRALQIDRGWFLSLVDASLLAQYPERRGRLPGDSLEDAPLRKVWNELAEEWLARVEQLPLALRRRLGSFSNGDWERRQQALVRQGLSPEVLRELVSGSAQNLLPGRADAAIPPEPFRQLWFAAAETTLESLRVEPIALGSQVTRVITAEVPASGVRLFPIRLPAGHGLALAVNGTPLLQMSLYAADGSRLEPRGPLRQVSLPGPNGSPLQLLITNEGVAPSLITLSLRADPPAPEAPSPAAPEGAAPAPQPGAPEPPPVPPEGSATPPADPRNEVEGGAGEAAAPEQPTQP